ncbi:MAG: hypothetical protein KBB70_00460 [Candidatus Pacebacteria bacterium]|nr:hypothetical protein [Candidatus Paceibacterota bacterium]
MASDEKETSPEPVAPNATGEKYTFTEFAEIANEYLEKADRTIESLSAESIEEAWNLIEIDPELESGPCLQSFGAYLLISAYCGFYVRKKIADKIKTVLRSGCREMNALKVIEALKLIWELSFYTIVITTRDEDKDCLNVAEASDSLEILEQIEKIKKWKAEKHKLYKDGFEMMKIPDTRLSINLRRKNLPALLAETHSCHALGTSANCLYHESKRIITALEKCVADLQVDELYYYLGENHHFPNKDIANVYEVEKREQEKNLLAFLVMRQWCSFEKTDTYLLNDIPQDKVKELNKVH